MAWEKGELFPAKAQVVEMEALRAKGTIAVVRMCDQETTHSRNSNLDEAGGWPMEHHTLLLTEPTLGLPLSKCAARAPYRGQYVPSFAHLTKHALATLGGRVVLHFPPSYCPDANRIERVRRDIHAGCDAHSPLHEEDATCR